jgi:hypothetical protein
MKRLTILCSLFVFACSSSSKKSTPTPGGGIDGSASIDSSAPYMSASSAQACAMAAAVPCGGNMVGAWDAVGKCGTENMPHLLIQESGSVEICAKSAGYRLVEHVVVGADGTTTQGGTEYTDISYDEGCLKTNGVTCANAGGTCVSQGGVCACTSTFGNGRTETIKLVFSGTGFDGYDLNGNPHNDHRGYCVQGDVLTVTQPDSTTGGSGTMVYVRSTEVVDGGVDTVKHDTGVINPTNDGGADRSTDKPNIDGGGTCLIGNVCSTNSDCQNGMTCQKISTLNGQTAGAMLCMPSQCTTCTNKDCIYDDRVSSCGFVMCAAKDAGVADAPADKPKTDTATDRPAIDAGVIDATPIDATPLPLDALPPSGASACGLAATAPCGGDVTGTWQLSGTCDQWLSETELLAQIKMTCSTWVDNTQAGTAVFNADGTCTVDEKSIYQTDYAVSCLTQNSDTCSAKNTRIKSEIGSNNVVDASCTLVSTSACRCNNTFEMPLATDACTYKAGADGLTFVSPPSVFAADTFDYCVQADTLTIFVSPTSAVGKSCADCTAGYVMVRAK